LLAAAPSVAVIVALLKDADVDTAVLRRNGEVCVYVAKNAVQIAHAFRFGFDDIGQGLTELEDSRSLTVWGSSIVCS